MIGRASAKYDETGFAAHQTVPPAEIIASSKLSHTFSPFQLYFPNLSQAQLTSKKPSSKPLAVLSSKPFKRHPHACHLTRTTIPATPLRDSAQPNNPPTKHNIHNRNHGTGCMG
jgi:hypothetical protein